MKKYKITTSWTGYSEITCKAKNKEEAEDIAFESKYSDTRSEVKSTDDAGEEIFGIRKEDEQLVNIIEEVSDKEVLTAVKKASISVACLIDDVAVNESSEINLSELQKDVEHLQDQITITENYFEMVSDE